MGEVPAGRRGALSKRFVPSPSGPAGPPPPCDGGGILMAREYALTADLAAHAVFLVVEHALVVAGDVAAVARGHAALLVADLVILAMKLARLAAADLALAALLVDPAVLVAQPVVHLVPPRMVSIPGRLGQGAAGR